MSRHAQSDGCPTGQPHPHTTRPTTHAPTYATCEIPHRTVFNPKHPPDYARRDIRDVRNPAPNRPPTRQTHQSNRSLPYPSVSFCTSRHTPRHNHVAARSRTDRQDGRIDPPCEDPLTQRHPRDQYQPAQPHPKSPCEDSLTQQTVRPTRTGKPDGPNRAHVRTGSHNDTYIDQNTQSPYQ